MQQDNSASSFAPSGTGIFTGALAASLGGLLAFAAVLLLRGGLGDSVQAVAALYFLAITPVWLSAWALSWFAGDALHRALAVMITLVLGTLLPAVGLVFPAVALALAAVALLLGLWQGRWAIVSGCRDWRVAVAALLMAALLLLLTLPLRFYMQEALMLGVANSDNYLHAANMQMLLHYGRIAIGADGLGYQNYHWLFHILVAGAARATHADVTLVYGYWTALTLKLQLVWALFVAGQLLYPTDGERSVGWRLAYGWLVMTLASGLEMESYMQGVALFMGWLPLLLALLRNAPSISRLSLGGIAALIAGAFICAAAKASGGYYCAIGLVLLAWHMRARPGVAIGLLVALGGLAFFANSLLLPKDVLIGNASLGILATSYLTYFQRGILLHWLLPPALALIFIWRPRGAMHAHSQSFALNLTASPAAARDAATLPSWLAHGARALGPLHWLALADARAQFLLLSFLGTLFVALTIPLGDNLWDFSVILFMASLLLLPAALGETLNARLADPLVKILLAAALAAQSALASAQFAFNPMTSLPQAWVALYRQTGGITQGQSTGTAKDIVLSLKTTHMLLARLHARIESAPATVLERTLEREARAVDGRLAVHVTPAADEIWHFFEKTDSGKWCLYPQLLVPATTGVVEIRSIPSSEIQKICMVPGMVWYGYGKFQDIHRTGTFTPDELCAMGRKMGARRIYRLESINQLERNRVLDCLAG